MAVLDWLQSLLGGNGQQSAGGVSPYIQNPQTGAFEPYTPPPAKSALDLAYEQLGGKDMYEAAQAAQRGEYLPALGQGAYGAGQAASMAVPVLRSGMAAVRAGVPVAREMAGALPALMRDEFGGIKAYHGSPYDFERFDPSKIGTGEGAQAYGHGLYFAEDPRTAEMYRSALAPGPTEIVAPGGDVVSQRGAIGSTQALADALSPHVKGDDYIRRAIARAWLDRPDLPLSPEDVSWNAFGSMAARDSPEAQALVSKMLTQAQPVLDKFKMRRPGVTYEVDINADPQRLLDLDKPLSQQSAEVQEAIRRGGAYQGPSMSLGGDAAGTVLKRALTSPYHAADLFNKGGEPFQLTAADISQRLNQAGIPGSRYLDQGSRGAGQGTSNYVMFDPALITILRKYGILGPAAGAGLLGAADQ